MSLTLLQSDDELDFRVKKNQSMIVEVSDGIHTETVFDQTIHKDLIIESGITFSDGGLFEPWSGIGCFLGTKKSVERFKKNNDI